MNVPYNSGILGNCIICSFIDPENEPEFGHIKIDFTSGEIVFLQKAPSYTYFGDARHAWYELMRLAKLEEPPKEKTVLWY